VEQLGVPRGGAAAVSVTAAGVPTYGRSARITPALSWSWNMAGEPVGQTWHEARRTIHPAAVE
jgi:pyridoxamine 5'-phosphate oxidase family protein